MSIVYAAAIGALFGLGVFLLLRRNVIRSAIGLTLVGSAVNLFLVFAGASQATAPPYAGVEGQPADPLPQALVLTAIVIGLGGFAFVLAALVIFAVRYRTADLDRIDRLKH
ncbi:MAG: sodium:proton antiporter [Phycisphaeraceae bacterium]